MDFALTAPDCESRGHRADPRPGPAPRILIVDDNIGLAENIAEILEDQGFATQVAGSGEEALAATLDDAVGILITDFRLPGIDGAELVTRLRQRRGHLSAVVISAYNDETTIDTVKKARAEFLAKPIDFARLSWFVRQHGGLA
jgi:DNA-binding NtrC family response regulator